MSYRNIHVNGRDYEYVVGPNFLKIKGIGLFRKDQIGNEFRYKDMYVITPATVRAVIEGNKVPIEYSCKRHGVKTTKLEADPFEAEIYQKTMLVVDCPTCLANSADDI
jgi:hypothetical protein